MQHFHDVDAEHLVGEIGDIDVGVSLNYPTVIGQGAIDAFKFGILNAHGGDLPRYRGNACQAWALLKGESRIGLCIHRMVGGELDSGPVVVRRHLDVTIDTRVGEVIAWMEASVPGMFVEAVRRVGEPGATFEEQDNAAALRCYPRLPGDAQIDWRADRDDILRLINASSEPFAGAFTSYRGDKVVIWRAARIDDVDEKHYLAVPGQISFIDRGSGTVDVITGRGRLRLFEVEVGGKRGRSADFLASTRTRLV
jgi:UDP-4-amino-4-deoxy-L-arabinose formyltransferase/UDP-glucuronic acid dehydrogenase (UDP-4-keto-hexauronic acid decarboxylating)